MIRASLGIIFLLTAEGLNFGFNQYTVSIVSFGQSNETGVWDISTIRLMGRERLVNGTVTLHEDMDNSHWSFSMDMYFDADRNGNYKLMPFNVPKMPVCDAYKNYRKYFAKQAKVGKQTDFPFHMDVCPIPKGTYFLKGISLNADGFPPMVQRGYARGDGAFYYDDVHVGNYTITVLLEDKQ
ncbi:uncharacterized protein LOC128266118 [Drosophila gunungcola]|uniref:uncharacterized protein LOC128266118 n=1 Tax=Drosophila gunungcola TaxID=103775 RepID=UPI0022E0E5F3|nr:uncharacterized protein LOC128266118 [Drosophila gunungcola]